MVFDAGLATFYIDAVDEKFCAVGGECLQCGWGDLCLGKALPSVGDDPEGVAAPAAAEVQHEALLADDGYEALEALIVDPAFAEYVGGHDDVAGAGIEVCFGVVGSNAAAELKPSWVGGESSESSLLVSYP